MKICGKCRRQFNGDEMFCPECGIQLQQFVQAPDAEVQGEGTQVVPQERKFSFEKVKIHGGSIITEVTVQGSKITIYQKKCWGFISWGKLNVNLFLTSVSLLPSFCTISVTVLNKMLLQYGFTVRISLYFVQFSLSVSNCCL